ncbi:hypothetical protein EV688_11152 [Chromatocurvus halotolerans]|uniref:Uncharacterized protein n=1 Tax=Chromatocurvus halotolerans TaxID=1132028 RepID=A0A4R2L6R6_9GAMM|nr:hypothetical protein EV688_11152 [Chromatocurvus halotolerans]
MFGNSHEPDGFNFLHAGYHSETVNLIRFGTTNACPGLTPRRRRKRRLPGSRQRVLLC